MRIVAGEYRGRTLVAPGGAGTRPTSDRVREAMFATVGDVTGLDALDLFAGSGALGMEALSRGAATATFVERDRAALAAIRANARMVDEPSRIRILQRDWEHALRAERAAGRSFGLCLVDPPYSLLSRITGRLGPALAPVLAPAAIVVVEYAARAGPVELHDLAVATRTDRAYGGTGIAVMRIAEAA